MLKILNDNALWENKKLSDENQHFDWIKSIHWYRLVNTGDDLTCSITISKNESTVREHG